MSLLVEALEQKTPEQIANLGKASDKCRDAGAHLVTIEAVYETTGATWSRFNIDFKTATGESLQITEFLGIPKDDSADAITKAEAATNRVLSVLGRVAKAAGIKDTKAAMQGGVAGTDAKGNATTTFPKLTNKKLTVISFTEIQPSQDETKAYANQEIDTMTILDKDGKDPMGRERAEALGAAAKSKFEIQFNKENVPACVKLRNELVEKSLRAPQSQPAQTQAQPTQTAAAQQTAADNDDI